MENACEGWRGGRGGGSHAPAAPRTSNATHQQCHAPATPRTSAPAAPRTSSSTCQQCHTDKQLSIFTVYIKQGKSRKVSLLRCPWVKMCPCEVSSYTRFKMCPCEVSSYTTVQGLLCVLVRCPHTPLSRGCCVSLLRCPHTPLSRGCCVSL